MNSNSYTDDELKDFPLLNTISRENPFKVPDGYFDSLPALIAERIAKENSKPERIVSFKKIFHPRYAVRHSESVLWRIAACLLIAALISGVVYFNQPDINNNPELALTYDDISNSVYMYDLDENLLIEELAQYGDESSAGDQAEIENYLIENQADFSQIENEL